VIFTTHNMDEADRLVDRLVIIDHGRLLVLDTAEALKRSCGEGDVLEIRLKPLGGPAQAIPAALGDMASFARSTEDVLEIRHPEVVEILSTILERLRRAGYTPAEVHLRENTLEDVFISLTGRSLRE
jgi:ABC-2 type transport system ATP-binding protein